MQEAILIVFFKIASFDLPISSKINLKSKF